MLSPGAPSSSQPLTSRDHILFHVSDVRFLLSSTCPLLPGEIYHPGYNSSITHLEAILYELRFPSSPSDL